MLRFVTVFFGFCITQILATLKQPFRRSIMNRITELQLPKLDLHLNLLADLPNLLKFPMNIFPQVSLINEWTSMLKAPMMEAYAAQVLGSSKTAEFAHQKRLKLTAPMPPANRAAATRCVNTEAIIAMEALLLCFVPFAIGLEEIASPIAILELMFFAICSVGAKTKLEIPSEQNERVGDRDWYEMWRNVLSTVDDPKQWLTSYFIDAKFEDLYREDVFDFMTWAMFTTTPEYLTKKNEYAVIRAVKQIESHIKYQFKTRPDGVAPFTILRPSIETLRWAHKPLLFYFVTQGIFGALLSHRMKSHQFVKKTEGELTYWTNCDTIQSDKVPIVMCHGIGGLCAYFDFVRALIPLDCPMIVLEIPSVSLHIAPNVPTVDAHVDSITNILDSHGYEKALFIGHSFGSSIVSWVVQCIPERVAGSVFMDPVVFMLHLTDILNNWTYEEPLNELSVAGLMDIVKTELFASNTVQRHFCWHRNILFASELQKSGTDSLIILSGADKIVPSSAVLSHIEQHNRNIKDTSEESLIQAIYLEDAPHGGIIFQEKYQSEAIRNIGNLVNFSTKKFKSNIKPRPYDMRKKNSLLRTIPTPTRRSLPIIQH